MARVTELNGFRPIWIWDVDKSVGVYAGSSRPDVMLVQVCLNKLIRTLDLRDERKPFHAGPENPLLGQVHGYPLLDLLEKDGYCGNETGYAIKQYQNKKGGSADSAVDPVHPLVGTSQGKIIFRTMFSLNADILRFFGKLPDEAEFPPLLRADVAKGRG